MNGMNRSNIGKGIAAGFAATIVLSLIMVMKQTMGLMPELNPIHMLSQMMDTQTAAVGWVAHFFIGAVIWGALYAWLDAKLPGPHWLRGILFATGAWLLMMIVVMPMAGAGVFGLQIGMMAPVATLVLHWIFGAVLGGLYGAWAPSLRAA